MRRLGSFLRPDADKVYGDLNFCHRLGSTIFHFPYRFIPLRVAEQAGAFTERATSEERTHSESSRQILPRLVTTALDD
jgi:hypothetical protein